MLDLEIEKSISTLGILLVDLMSKPAYDQFLTLGDPCV